MSLQKREMNLFIEGAKFWRIKRIIKNLLGLGFLLWALARAFQQFNSGLHTRSVFVGKPAEDHPCSSKSLMKEHVPCPSPKAARQVRSTTRTWLVIESEGQTVRQSSTEASRRVRHADLSHVYSELTALIAHANTVAAVASSSSPRLNSS